MFQHANAERLTDPTETFSDRWKEKPPIPKHGYKAERETKHTQNRCEGETNTEIPPVMHIGYVVAHSVAVPDHRNRKIKKGNTYKTKRASKAERKKGEQSATINTLN